jgi:hypothetical protein
MLAQHLQTGNLPMSLKLLAFDVDDLTVISTYVQDALCKVGDLRWRQGQGQFELLLNRFRWEMAEKPRRGGGFERGGSSLHFSRVTQVKSNKIVMANADGVLELLAVVFETGDAPSGDIVLQFSGDGTIRLSVECIEAQLADIGSRWETKSRPAHQPSE